MFGGVSTVWCLTQNQYDVSLIPLETTLAPCLSQQPSLLA